MQNFKKLAAFALAATMSLGLLTACGGGTTGTADTPAASTDTPAATESAAPESETPAADGTFTTVEEGKLVMTTSADFPPYEYTTDDGGYAGIDVDIAQAIAEKLGLELVINDVGFDNALLAVQQGQSDIVMAGVTVTEERLLSMDFSNSYANGVQVVIVTEDSDIQSIEDLDGKLIGTQMGTTGYLYCSDTPENGGYGEDAVVPYENGMTAIQALQNGQVDCVVIDNEPAKAFVEANPGLKILDTEFANEDYAIGVAKGNTALLDAINGALAELEADGTLQSIVDQYITAE